jgi:hypothetical protein
MEYDTDELYPKVESDDDDDDDSEFGYATAEESLYEVPAPRREPLLLRFLKAL